MNQSTDQSLGDVLTKLAHLIHERRGGDTDASYTASLLAAGPEKCARKFGEEAIETVIAGVASDRQALTREAADALYHLLVLLEVNDIAPGDIAAELRRREGVSGHVEKASRSD